MSNLPVILLNSNFPPLLSPSITPTDAPSVISFLAIYGFAPLQISIPAQRLSLIVLPIIKPFPESPTVMPAAPFSVIKLLLKEI